MEVPESVRPVVDFVIHLVVGGVGFCVVLLVAAGVGGVVALIESAGFHPIWFTNAADLVERGVFYLDIGIFGLFSVVETIKVLRAYAKEVFHG